MTHGTLFGADDGSLWRVFSPPWWRLDRWIWFLLVRTDKARLTINGVPVYVTAAGARLATVPVRERKL